jgi:type IV secretion system protein VirB1
MGAILTAAAVLGLAATCQHSFPPEMILAIARNESMVAPDQFDPHAVSKPNRDGSRDLGLLQINTKNLGWLGLTEAAVMDPCINVGAAEAVLRQFSQYNSGSPTKSADYAKRAYLALRSAASVHPAPTTEAPNPKATTDRPAIFARKAKIGRELVINVSKENP